MLHQLCTICFPTRYAPINGSSLPRKLVPDSGLPVRVWMRAASRRRFVRRCRGGIRSCLVTALPETCRAGKTNPLRPELPRPFASGRPAPRQGACRSGSGLRARRSSNQIKIPSPPPRLANDGAHGLARPGSAKRLGLRQPSGALSQGPNRKAKGRRTLQ